MDLKYLKLSITNYIKGLGNLKIHSSNNFSSQGRKMQFHGRSNDCRARRPVKPSSKNIPLKIEYFDYDIKNTVKNI